MSLVLISGSGVNRSSLGVHLGAGRGVFLGQLFTRLSFTTPGQKLRIIDKQRSLAAEIKVVTASLIRRHPAHSFTLDSSHLLEPLHPGLSLRSPLPVSSGSGSCQKPVKTPAAAVTAQPQHHSETVFQQHHSIVNGVANGHQQQQQQQPQDQRTINEFQLKCGFGWRRLQTAMFQCAACCVRCIGPV